MTSTASRRRYSLRDYLDVEELSVVRHEFIDGEIVAMAGGTPEHAALSGTVSALLGAAIRGRPCRVYSADLRIRVLATGLATYADAVVICGPEERDPDSPTHVTNPTLIVEVLSPSTEDYDRTEKRAHYQRIPALREYVLVAQDRAQIDRWRREPSGEWIVAVFGAGSHVELTSIGATLDVDELYATAGAGAVGGTG